MPVSITRLKELIELARSGGVEAIDMVEDGTHIRITRHSSGPLKTIEPERKKTNQAAEKAIDPELYQAPMFGVLHLTPAPGARPYVMVGDQVRQGQQLCLLEAMKMFNPCYSDRAGRIEAILAEAGHEVLRGQPLFRIARD